MEKPKNPKLRSSIIPGMVVELIRKQDQRSGSRTRGIVQDILTNSLSHPYGIKVRLKDGTVGRVAEIFSSETPERK